MTSADQQTSKSSVKTLKRFLERKMKTVLAPNAPWPDPNQNLCPKVKSHVRIDTSSFELDYFADAREQIAQKHRLRDSATGRFKSNARVAR